MLGKKKVVAFFGKSSKAFWSVLCDRESRKEFSVLSLQKYLCAQITLFLGEGLKILATHGEGEIVFGLKNSFKSNVSALLLLQKPARAVEENFL